MNTKNVLSYPLLCHVSTVKTLLARFGGQDPWALSCAGEQFCEVGTERVQACTHRASTSMYSLTFCVRVMLPERHQWKPAVQVPTVQLRTPPVTRQSPASSARRPRPAGRSHYVVISRDGRKLVTRVRVMMP